MSLQRQAGKGLGSQPGSTSELCGGAVSSSDHAATTVGKAFTPTQ